jgi:hypothetical protein
LLVHKQWTTCNEGVHARKPLNWRVYWQTV